MCTSSVTPSAHSSQSFDHLALLSSSSFETSIVSHNITLQVDMAAVWALQYRWMLQSAAPLFDCLCRRRCWQSTSPYHKTSPNSCHLAGEPVTMLHSCPCSNSFKCWSWHQPVIVPIVGSKQLVGWRIHVGGHYIGKQLVWQWASS